MRSLHTGSPDGKNNPVDLEVDKAVISRLQLLWTITFSAKFFSAKLLSNCPLFEQIFMSLDASILDAVFQSFEHRHIVVHNYTTPFISGNFLILVILIKILPSLICFLSIAFASCDYPFALRFECLKIELLFTFGFFEGTLNLFKI